MLHERPINNSYLSSCLHWQASAQAQSVPLDQAATLLEQVNCPIFALDTRGEGVRLTSAGSLCAPGTPGSTPLLAYVPPLNPQRLGDPAFKERYGLKYAYVSGSMARGIASQALTETVARQGMLGFFGAAGLLPEKVEEVLVSLQNNLGADASFGLNLIHSPQDPALEDRLIDIYLTHGLHNIEASAFLNMSLPLVRYRYRGIHQLPDGTIAVPNRVMAKISRLEVAEKFLQPAPQKMLDKLVEDGRLTPEEAALAARISVASEVTAEADSGGHTDNRPAISLIPSVIDLRDRLSQGIENTVAIGAAGGIATPASTACAFAMGAAYVVTGSVNQACVESGTCDQVRLMLAKAGPADVAMAPAADMFEMGVNVQVLKWGTLFANRAKKLYDIYKRYDCFEDVPEKDRNQIEKQLLRQSFSDAWASTAAFFAQRDPQQVTKAEENPKHKMALVFRSYLGQASRWASQGDETRRSDYQIWCGPALGTFNAWAKGSFLEEPANRRAATVALNLLTGSCAVTRANWLSLQGVNLPAVARHFAPHTLNDLETLLKETDKA